MWAFGNLSVNYTLYHKEMEFINLISGNKTLTIKYWDIFTVLTKVTISGQIFFLATEETLSFHEES